MDTNTIKTAAYNAQKLSDIKSMEHEKSNFFIFMYNLKTISEQDQKIYTTIKINNKPIRFELNTTSDGNSCVTFTRDCFNIPKYPLQMV